MRMWLLVFLLGAFFSSAQAQTELYLLYKNPVNGANTRSLVEVSLSGSITVPAAESVSFGTSRVFVNGGVLSVQHGAGPIVSLEPVGYDVPVSVGTSNQEGVSATAARSDHVHDSGVGTYLNKGMTPAVTSGDGEDTGLVLAAAPANADYVVASINGVLVPVGDGVSTECSHFEDPGVPATPKALNTVTTGDKFIWNGLVCGYDLDANDRVDFYFETF